MNNPNRYRFIITALGLALASFVMTSNSIVPLFGADAEDVISESTESSILSINAIPALAEDKLLDDERAYLATLRQIVDALSHSQTLDEARLQMKGVPQKLWSELDEDVTFHSASFIFDSLERVRVYFISDKGCAAIELDTDVSRNLHDLYDARFKGGRRTTATNWDVCNFQIFSFGSKECFKIQFSCYKQSTRSHNLTRGEYRDEQQTPEIKRQDFYFTSAEEYQNFIKEKFIRQQPLYVTRHCVWDEESCELVEEENYDEPLQVYDEKQFFTN